MLAVPRMEPVTSVFGAVIGGNISSHEIVRRDPTNLGGAIVSSFVGSAVGLGVGYFLPTMLRFVAIGVPGGLVAYGRAKNRRDQPEKQG